METKITLRNWMFGFIDDILYFFTPLSILPTKLFNALVENRLNKLLPLGHRTRGDVCLSN